jgi:uncharacterized membrane protein
MSTPDADAPRRAEDRETRHLYRRSAAILRAGFVCALALMAVGLGIALVRDQTIDGSVVSLGDIPGALLDGDAQAILDLGILVLLVTPVAVIVAALAAFARQRDWRFVGVCLALVAILASSVGLALL